MQKEESLKSNIIQGAFRTSNWFNRLKEYFPEREMKSRKHFEILLEEQAMYQVMEDEDFILVYFEQQEYVFIDYILVTGNNRSKGVGSKVLNILKEKGKAIILEVEPISPLDPDSEKRIRFYSRNDFKMMEGIGYERIHMVTNELSKMDILCWSPASVTEEWVLDQMKDIYTKVHSYKAKEIYGRIPQSVTDVLWIKDYIKEMIQ